MNIDLELYRVFYEVVKYKNITKTAENMHISQSAITQSIHKLEGMLGGNVFYRNKTGVELTPEGEKLYDYIKDSIETMSNAENLFSQNINLENGKVRIGGGDTQVSTLIIDPLMKFLKDYKNIDIRITSGRTDILTKRLLNGELDIIAIRRNLLDDKIHSNIDFIPLKKSTYCLIASKKFVKDNKIKSLKDISKLTAIVPNSSTSRRELFDEFCKEEKIELNNKYEVTSSSIVKKLVLNDLGIGFIDNRSIDDIKDEIEILKEHEFINQREGIATLNKKMCNKATLEFVKYIKKYNEE